jgi:hypothetical protein
MNQPSSQQEQKEQESHNTRKEMSTKSSEFTSYIVFTCVADPWHVRTDPDPNFWQTDPNPDPDPAIFANDLQKCN